MKRTLLTVLPALLIGACAQTDEEPAPDDPAPEVSVLGTMNVVTRGLTLEAPTQIPSGWTTIRFANESPMTHFVVVERVPQGEGLVSQQEEVAPVFQEGMDLLTAGDMDGALAQFGDLPPWFGEIVFFGGPGLTAPSLVSQATMFLEPGTYLLECYVKTAGVFHSYNPDPALYGMVHEFTVTEGATDVGEPAPTIQLDISSAEGVQMRGDVVSGEQTIAVHFVDQTVHENFVGHDVHVVRISDDLDLGGLEEWMDWRVPTGLQTPAPALFLGGINEMPAGTTGYFSVNLEPGRYAWVAEVPNAAEKGMLLEFTVR